MASFLTRLLAQYPDDDSIKPVFLQADGKTTVAEGQDRHVLLYWENGTGLNGDLHYIQILQLSGGYTYVARHAMPSYEDLFSVYPGVRSPFDAPVELPSSYDMKASAIILHSSGTLHVYTHRHRRHLHCLS